jgi:protein SCO1/2
VLAGCGGAPHGAGGSDGVRPIAELDAPAQLEPPRLATEISLKDSLGRPVTLSEYRGKAVLLTFIYDHCPDVCPLIVANLHDALDLLGAKARQVQIVAVSVDPRGDTRATVAAFLAAHEMTGRMQYLIGSAHELAPVWREWGVAVEATPDRREVSHAAFVYGISASGRVIALYPSNLKPQWIAHDVPVLASS